ncbi:MAG TPA: NADH-quinone oxidoreductase subunit C [Candidatus Eisenbacteria bacterium]|jgi:NADH-quinone oxidoreductase subunit C|nr:NADH-quinone oxidoreductase subunit C [Candidatus Eisenbacteria bacterium]
MDAAPSLAQAVRAKYPNLVTAAEELPAGPTVTVKREGARALAASLKSDPEFRFNMLMDLFAVDYLHWEEKEFRYEVVYNLFSLEKNRRLFVKVLVPETDPSVDSVVPVWPAADWFERETWDMMGVTFRGHPNLKRILMYESFEGHALRKDYRYNQRQPLIGPMN